MMSKGRGPDACLRAKALVMDILCSSSYAVVMRSSSSAMRTPTYHILAALLDGPLHGYAIIARVAESSGAQVRLATGTLYAALDRLSDEAYIAVMDEQIVNGRARRSYGLTDSGMAALRAEATRMAEAARLVIDRIPGSAAAGAVKPA